MNTRMYNSSSLDSFNLSRYFVTRYSTCCFVKLSLISIQTHNAFLHAPVYFADTSFHIVACRVKFPIAPASTLSLNLALLVQTVLQLHRSSFCILTYCRRESYQNLISHSTANSRSLPAICCNSVKQFRLSEKWSVNCSKEITSFCIIVLS